MERKIKNAVNTGAIYSRDIMEETGIAHGFKEGQRPFVSERKEVGRQVGLGTE